MVSPSAVMVGQILPVVGSSSGHRQDCWHLWKDQPSCMPVGMLEVTLLALGDAALDNISPGPSQGKPFCSLGAG